MLSTHLKSLKRKEIIQQIVERKRKKERSKERKNFVGFLLKFLAQVISKGWVDNMTWAIKLNDKDLTSSIS